MSGQCEDTSSQLHVDNDLGTAISEDSFSDLEEEAQTCETCMLEKDLPGMSFRFRNSVIFEVECQNNHSGVEVTYDGKVLSDSPCRILNGYVGLFKPGFKTLSECVQKQSIAPEEFKVLKSSFNIINAPKCSIRLQLACFSMDHVIYGLSDSFSIQSSEDVSLKLITEDSTEEDSVQVNETSDAPEKLAADKEEHDLDIMEQQEREIARLNIELMIAENELPNENLALREENSRLQDENNRLIQRDLNITVIRKKMDFMEENLNELLVRTSSLDKSSWSDGNRWFTGNLKNAYSFILAIVFSIILYYSLL